MIKKLSGLTQATKVIDAAEGIVEAYVNTMGVIDSDNDVISPNAFDKSIQKASTIPVLYGHDQSSIVGKILKAKPMEFEDQHRLYAQMQFNMDKASGRDAFSDVKGGFINQWSVGFNIPSDGFEMDGEKRTINELDLVEVSLVIRGASPDTSTIGVKSRSANMIKPFPDFHVCHIRDSEEFDKFLTAPEIIEDGDYEGRPVNVIFGREGDSGDWKIVSFHLPVKEWTEEEAEAFCDEHDGIKFEPATGDSDTDEPEDEEEESATDTETAVSASDAVFANRFAKVKAELDWMKARVGLSLLKPKKKKPKY